MIFLYKQCPPKKVHFGCSKIGGDGVIGDFVALMLEAVCTSEMSVYTVLYPRKVSSSR
jgi:hypothetical protein